jgi:hypothetical protein
MITQSQSAYDAIAVGDGVRLRNVLVLLYLGPVKCGTVLKICVAGGLKRPCQTRKDHKRIKERINHFSVCIVAGNTSRLLNSLRADTCGHACIKFVDSFSAKQRIYSKKKQVCFDLIF